MIAKVFYVVEFQSALDGKWISCGATEAPFTTLAEAITHYDLCTSAPRRIASYRPVNKWLINAERKRMAAALSDQHKPKGEGRTNS